MRKYTGKYPNRIHSISGFGRGLLLVETNNGGKYFVHAKDTKGKMPTLDDDVFDCKFQRAHVQYYRQDVTRFFRIIEDHEFEFFNMTPSGVGIAYPDEIGDLELAVRRDFCRIMAQQNVLVRFK